jgi:hypothetical protein
MSQGQLLPDEVIFRLLSKRLEHGASCGELMAFPAQLTKRYGCLKMFGIFLGVMESLFLLEYD